MIYDPSIFLKSVIEIAEKAGSLLLKYYASDIQSTIIYKEDQSPVTIADKAANEYIVTALKKINPDIPILSEESFIPDYNFRRNWKYFWLIDPLDGTKEFIKRNGEFTVNIALIHNRKPVLGVVYAPTLKSLFWALKGKGAFKSENGEIRKLKSNEINPEQSDLKIVLSRSHLDVKTKDYLKNFNNPKVMNRGSSLKFMDIASGDADIYFRLNKVSEWDTAASHIILYQG